MQGTWDVIQDVLDIMKDSLVSASKTPWGVMQDSKAKDAMQEFLDIMQDYLDAKESIKRRYETFETPYILIWHLRQQQQSVKNKTKLHSDVELRYSSCIN